MKKLTTIFSLVFLVLFASACKNEKSLQSYLVESSGRDGFFTGDLPVSSILSVKADVSDEIKAEFESYLTSSNYFKEVLYTDKKTAYNNLKKDLGEDFSSVLENNPLFDAYDAYVNAKFVTTQGLTEIESFIHEFGGGSIVQDIFYQKNLVEKLNIFIYFV
mgnify:CR=1 FL=1